MTKYVFLNIPAQGHVNPTLALARELVERGEEVEYYLTEDFRSTIESTGATFHPYTSLLAPIAPPEDFDLSSLPENVDRSMLFPLLLVDEARKVVPQVFDAIRSEQPDYIIYDMMCLWGRIIAHALHIPAILSHPTYVGNRQVNLVASLVKAMPQLFTPEFIQPLNKKLATLCQEYGAPPYTMGEMSSAVEPLDLVFMPREFHPGGDAFDDHFVFVGPSISPRTHSSSFPLQQLAGQKVLLISLGTELNKQPAFFKQCIAAFADTPWLVVMAIGKDVKIEELGSIPANFLVAPFVPQLEVLQHAATFVTHGGMNSTMESIYYGVPMVAIPQMPEQVITSQRLQDLGLGLSLDKQELSTEKLRSAVEQVMNDPTYRMRMTEMQDATHAAGGYKRAADELARFASQQQSSRVF